MISVNPDVPILRGTTQETVNFNQLRTLDELEEYLNKAESRGLIFDCIVRVNTGYINQDVCIFAKYEDE